MNSEMVLDTIHALELRWRDLAAELGTLAATLPRQRAFSFREPINGVPGVRELYFDLVGVTDTDVTRVTSLQQQAIDEAEAVKTAHGNLKPDLLTAYLVTKTPTGLTPGATLPPGTTDGGIEIFAHSKASLEALQNTVTGPPFTPPVRAGFTKLFAESKQDTLEVANCRSHLAQLLAFIDRSLRNFRELTDTTGFTKQFDIRGIRGSVDNIAAYPLITADAGWRGGGGASSAGRDLSSVRRTIEGTIREVLGRNPRAGDTRSFLTSLTASFAIQELEGRTEVTWTPRTYAGQTDLGGGISGGQASLAARAQVALDQVLPLLGGLYSLRDDADPELVESTRRIVSNEFTELVRELGLEGGPRVARVDGLFNLLLRQKFSVPLPPNEVDGHLRLLQYELGLFSKNVNTLEEETNFTNYIALEDYVSSVRTGWEVFRTTLFGKDLGTRFVHLSRSLSVAAESVGEITEAMDSVFVGSAERQVSSFVAVLDDGRPQRVSVGDLLSWVVDFSSDEAPKLVYDGGRRGADAIVPTADRLASLVAAFIEAVGYEPDLPDGMRQPRVLNPLRELLGHLQRVSRLAGDVRQVA